MAQLDDVDVKTLSRQEAEAYKLKLIADIEAIESQLSNRNMRDPMGNRLSADAYGSWRSKAVSAKRFKSQRLRMLKVHLEQLEPPPGADSLPAQRYLVHLLKLLSDLMEDGVELDAEELDIVKEVVQYLREVKRLPPLGVQLSERLVGYGS